MKHKPSFRPRKRFGQNFLQDPFIIQRIIEGVHPAKTDRVVEIGPGLGAITIPLLERVERLEVIELDRDLAHQLQNQFATNNKLVIHTQDALTFDFDTFYDDHLPDNKLRIVGNLPYNITTPLIFHLLKFSNRIKDMHFMLQKEVVDRLIAKPNTKDYGRLSIMVQYYCQTDALFAVPPEAFYPKPAVYSAFIRLTPYTEPPYTALDLELFQTITRTAFNQRRKTLSNALKPYLRLEDYKSLNLDHTLRPETLSVSDYVKISNFVASKKQVSL